MGAQVITAVVSRLGDYVEDEEEADVVEPLEERKKVTFADVIDKAISQHTHPDQYQHNQEEQLRKEQQDNIVRSLIKSIFEQDAKQKSQPPQQSDPKSSALQHPLNSLLAHTDQQEMFGDNVQEMQTLARSFY